MYTFICFLLIAILGLAFGSSHATTVDFYKGKTIRIIVGFSAGGGYDTYSRVIARHLGKHIADNPAVVVENMPGAGSLILANHIYNRAKPDGLTIGHFIGGLFLQQLLGKPGIEFDARKFEYLGVPAQDDFSLGLHKATGITTIEQWLASKTPVKFGGVSSGSGTDDIPNIFRVTIGLPVQLVSGYKGTADIRLAFNSGEVHGVSNSWQSFKATWRKELETGLVNIVLQAALRPHPDLLKVALAIDFAKTEEARKLIQAVVQVHGASVRPYVLPPGTPKERVQTLGRAFVDTMKDPEFLADAAKARLEINPLTSEELENALGAVFKLEPPLVAKLKDILK